MNCALIVAAGKGSRMGIEGGKQFLPLMGKPALAHTIAAFNDSPLIDIIIVITTEENLDLCQKVVNDFNFTKVKKIVIGGKERQDSVYNGLKAVVELDEQAIVAVHDGARPLITSDTIEDVFKNFKDCDGVVVGIPAIDTIKLVRDKFVVVTLNRNETWQIQTPQIFRARYLLEAHERARLEGFYGTDDSILIERIGGRIKVIEGTRENIKITTKVDLVLAEAILKERMEC